VFHLLSSSSVEVDNVPLRIRYVLNDLLIPLDVIRKRSFAVVAAAVVTVVVTVFDLVVIN